MRLILFIVIPLLISIITYFFSTKYTKVLVLITSATLFFLSLFFFANVNKNGKIIENLGGYESWQGISLIADSVSVLFVVLSTFLFLVLFIYAYNKDYVNHLFLFLFLLLEALINGIFLVGDLFSVYALVEVSTVCVAILIMFKKSKQSIYDGMLYLLINIVSMNFYLFGLAYVYKIFGTLNMDVISESLYLINDVRVLVLPYALMITALGLKSAIMPLFSWLPKAHGTPSAPSVVSAVLSALYVKCGLYMLVRISDVFESVIDVSTAFVLLGFLTGFIGFFLALSQTDIKLILAYHTVSQIGFIIFALFLDSEFAYYGGIYHIINHAVFKSTLFLSAGIIYEEYKTRDIRQIRGVFKRMPAVAVLTAIAIFGITGAPFFNGSVSKYLIGKGAFETSIYELGILTLNLGTILSFVKYSTMLFGESNTKSKVAKNQVLAISILSVITLLGGVFGEQIVEYLFKFPIHISPLDMLHKILVYIVNVGIGVAFYKYAYPRIRFFKHIREFELGFNEIVLSIFIFFVAFSGYMYVVL